MTVDRIEDFQALEPFFRVIEDGLAGLVDGGHFFDLLADDVVFEFIITVPDYPRRVVGRDNLIGLYRGYQNAFFLDRCFDLRTHRADDSTVTLEYASEGRAVRPDGLTTTTTSQSSPSRIVRSSTGGTTSTRSASSKRLVLMTKPGTDVNPKIGPRARRCAPFHRRRPCVRWCRSLQLAADEQLVVVGGPLVFS